jgi:hemolysin III
MYEGERFNSISHLVAVAVSLVGVSVLMTLAVLSQDIYKIVSCSIYGASMIVLFFFSTMYHSLKDGRAKTFFQKMDYAAIYLLIAGTYAPFTLVSLREQNGWLLFVAVWSLAIFGVAQDMIRNSKTRKTSLVIYLLMGWLIILDAHNLWKSLSPMALLFLVLGGVLYTKSSYKKATSKGR